MITHSSPSRSARVRSEARSEPALGSENPSDHISSAERMPGRRRRCCSSRADVDQRGTDDAEADVVEDARRVHARQLLGVDHLLARAGAAPAVLARPLRREPAAALQRALPVAEELVARPLLVRHVAPAGEPARRQIAARARCAARGGRPHPRRIGESDHGGRLTVVSRAYRGERRSQGWVSVGGALEMRASRPRSRQLPHAARGMEVAGWERGRLARISSATLLPWLPPRRTAMVPVPWTPCSMRSGSRCCCSPA